MASCPLPAPQKGAWSAHSTDAVDLALARAIRRCVGIEGDPAFLAIFAGADHRVDRLVTVENGLHASGVLVLDAHAHQRAAATDGFPVDRRICVGGVWR